MKAAFHKSLSCHYKRQRSEDIIKKARIDCVLAIRLKKVILNKADAKMPASSSSIFTRLGRLKTESYIPGKVTPNSEPK